MLVWQDADGLGPQLPQALFAVPPRDHPRCLLPLTIHQMTVEYLAVGWGIACLPLRHASSSAASSRAPRGLSVPAILSCRRLDRIQLPHVVAAPPAAKGRGVTWPASGSSGGGRRQLLEPSAACCTFRPYFAVRDLSSTFLDTLLFQIRLFMQADCLISPVTKLVITIRSP